MLLQVNEITEQSVRGRSPTSVQIDKASPKDDGWYQCHVGIYSGRRIIEKIGYIYLTVLGKK